MIHSIIVNCAQVPQHFFNGLIRTGANHGTGINIKEHIWASTFGLEINQPHPKLGHLYDANL
jgi:hypothetical protein